MYSWFLTYLCLFICTGYTLRSSLPGVYLLVHGLPSALLSACKQSTGNHAQNVQIYVGFENHSLWNNYGIKVMISNCYSDDVTMNRSDIHLIKLLRIVLLLATRREALVLFLLVFVVP